MRFSMVKYEIDAPSAAAAASEKRPYEVPKVRELGDVRELTRGSAGPGNDGKVAAAPS
jgi:hypothetical protein